MNLIKEVWLSNMNQYEGYDEIAQNVFYPIYEDIAKSMLERTGITRGKMLDIGCGGGHMGFAVMKLSTLNGNFVDIRQEAIDTAASRAINLGLDSRCNFKVMNVHSLEFSDNTFDLVVSRGSMPFWENQIDAFQEIYRVLAIGGKAYIGGGLGSAKLQEDIRKKMEERKNTEFHKFRKNSKALPTPEYIELFDKLNCSYEVIENTGEGRWFIFSKDGAIK